MTIITRPITAGVIIDGTDFVETYADLKAEDLTVGSFARTAGYFTAGDGGGADYEIVAAATGTADNAFYGNLLNGNQAKLKLHDPSTIHIRQLGALADGVTDDSARIVIVEATTGPAAAIENIDLGGLTVFTTLNTTTGFTKRYFNGPFPYGKSTLTVPQTARVKTQSNILDTSLIRNRTKSPVIDWEDKNILWLGTSIPQEGTDIDSYPVLVADALRANVVNMAWAGSHAFFDITLHGTIQDASSLSMTETDRLVALALYGGNITSNVYSDSYPGITHPSEMTYDFRVKAPFEITPFDVVVLDHNHNDRHRAIGTLTPETQTITGITKGATTQVTFSSLGTIAVGDSISLLNIVGIDNLNYAGERVQSIVGTTVTLNINSSGYSGSFTSGIGAKLDKATISGGFEFLIYGIKHESIINGDGSVKIILATAPSEFTLGTYDADIFNSTVAIKAIADKHSLGFFDIDYEYDVKEVDQPVYFGDLIHPDTLARRQALANLWVAWLSGGVPKAYNPDVFLPAGSDIAYVDQAPAFNSRFLDGFGTPKYYAPTAVSTFSEDFSGGIGTLTQVNAVIPVTFGAAPWDAAEFAANCLVPAGAVAPKTSALQKTIALSIGTAVDFDVQFPVVSGLLGVGAPLPSQSVLAEIRSAGAYIQCNAIIRDDTASLRMNYFKTANTTLVIFPVLTSVLAADTKYHVRLEQYRGTGPTDPGKLLFYVDSKLVGGPYDLDDSGQGSVASIRIGAQGVNTLADFQVYVGNLVISQFTVTDASTRYTGSIPAGSTITVVNGLIKSYV